MWFQEGSGVLTIANSGPFVRSDSLVAWIRNTRDPGKRDNASLQAPRRFSVTVQNLHQFSSDIGQLNRYNRF